MPRKKKRNKMTEMYYPEKMDVNDFLAEVERDIESFRQNMQALNSYRDKKKYIEDWMKIYIAWAEME